MSTRQYKYSLCLILFASLILTSSSNAQLQQVEIVMPGNIKKAIEQSAPIEKYVFYALKTSSPDKLADFAGRTLLFCSDEDEEGRIKNVNNFAINMFFGGLKSYSISKYAQSKITRKYAVYLPFEVKGEKVYYMFTEETSTFTPKEPIETLLTKCLDEMEKDSKAILLIKRNIIKIEQQGGMVEVVFK